MFFSVTTIEESKSTEDGILGYLHSAWRDGDMYLQLSALGLAVFVLLCCLICLAWMHYGSVISTVFDARSWSFFPQNHHKFSSNVAVVAVLSFLINAHQANST